MKKIAILSLPLAAVLVLGPAAKGFADTFYNNAVSVNGTELPFGNPNTATYGQSFSAPAGENQLRNFSLFLNGGTTGQLEGYVATWTGLQAGTILYTSAPVTVTGANQQFTFNPNLAVTPGAEYVAFISMSAPDYNGYSGTTTMPIVWLGNTIPGGHFEWINNGSDLSQFTGTAWDSETWGASLSHNEDAEFMADFGSAAGTTVTPEPSSLILSGTGILGLAGMVRRKLGLRA